MNECKNKPGKGGNKSEENSDQLRRISCNNHRSNSDTAVIWFLQLLSDYCNQEVIRSNKVVTRNNQSELEQQPTCDFQCIFSIISLNNSLGDP